MAVSKPALSAMPAALKEALQSLQNGQAAQCLRHLAAVLAQSPAPYWEALALEARGQACCALGHGEAGLDSLYQAARLLEREKPPLRPVALKAAQQDERRMSAALCRVWQNLCFALGEAGDLDAAARYGRRAVALAEALDGPDSARLAQALFRLSAVSYRQRHLDEAEALVERAKAIWQGQPGPMPQEVATCLNNLARIHEERGNHARGIALHREAVRLRRELPGKEDLAFSLGNLGVALAQDGQWNAAVAALDEALCLYTRLGLEHSSVARGYAANLAVCRQGLMHSDADSQ